MVDFIKEHLINRCVSINTTTVTPFAGNRSQNGPNVSPNPPCQSIYCVGEQEKTHFWLRFWLEVIFDCFQFISWSRHYLCRPPLFLLKFFLSTTQEAAPFNCLSLKNQKYDFLPETSKLAWWDISCRFYWVKLLKLTILLQIFLADSNALLCMSQAGHETNGNWQAWHPLLPGSSLNLCWEIKSLLIN